MPPLPPGDSTPPAGPKGLFGRVSLARWRAQRQVQAATDGLPPLPGAGDAEIRALLEAALEKLGEDL